MAETFSKRHRQRESKQRDRFFKIRNMLNIIFMIGALVGMVFYFWSNRQTIGIIIILAAIVFKIIECCLRFIR